MGQDNASITRAFYDAWNARDFDYGATHMSEDGTIELMGSGHMFKGPDGSRQYGESWAAAVPDGRVSIDRVVAAGDHVVVEFTCHGTHTGPMVTHRLDARPDGPDAGLSLRSSSGTTSATTTACTG